LFLSKNQAALAKAYLVDTKSGLAKISSGTVLSNWV